MSNACWEIAKRYRIDNVLSLALSLDDEKIERNWLIPELE